MPTDWSLLHEEALARNGGWVDYATVYYWYQDTPGGFQHYPLRPVAERQKVMLHRSAEPTELQGILERLEVDPQPDNAFATRQDMVRVRTTGTDPIAHPFWIDWSQPDEGNPNPSKSGILAVHPRDQETPCFLVRQVALPPQKRSMLRVIVSGDPFEAPGSSDFLLQAGIHGGKSLIWFKQETIDAGAPPSDENWRPLEL